MLKKNKEIETLIRLILKNRGDTYYVTKHELCLDVKSFLWSYFIGIF